MFEYFPDNYNWSLAVCLSLGMGGELSEIHDAGRILAPLAATEDDRALQAWFDEWTRIATRAAELGDADREAGRARSAANKYRRAANYHLIAERMMTNLSPLKRQSYEEALRVFGLTVKLGAEDVEFVNVPFEGASLPALYVPARDVTRPSRCLVMFNGYDVTKEILYLMGVGSIADRGVSLLITDQPGSGGALRLHGLPTRPDMEVPAGACIDYLETRSDVDPDRIGIAGISMGGYFAPRAAAMESRLKACVAWGAFHDLAGVAANLAKTAAHSAPSFQIAWVFGTTDPAEQRALLPRFSLDGVAEKIKCPLLVIHGSDDRQVPVQQAYHTVEQATASRSAELKLFGPNDWGDQHCQVDDPTLAIDYIADWVSAVL